MKFSTLILHEAQIVIAILAVVGMGDIPFRLMFFQDRFMDVVVISGLCKGYLNKVLFQGFCVRLGSPVWQYDVNSFFEQRRLRQRIYQVLQ